MENIVLEAIERFGLLSNGERRITVALSGGADSMALLRVLFSLKEKLGIKLDAAHLNHMIRGAEAERDEAFVKKECERLGIKLFCERVDVPQYAKEHNISIELAARRLRYGFLERVSSGLVATAHTASDNLETMIFNLARGTAVDGLCGIPPKRDKFIRPLLLCTRADIESYCQENEISFVTDSSNLCDEYTRNKIRHNIIPLIKDINPSAEIAALRTSICLREDSALLKGMAGDYLTANSKEEGLSLKGFSNLNSAVAKRVLKAYIENIDASISLESVHIEAVYAISLKGGRTSLPRDSFAEVRNGLLHIGFCCDEQKKEKAYAVNLIETDNHIFAKEGKINNLLLNNSLDCDKIVGKLVVRGRLPGDSIRLRNRGCTKTLNKLYNENRIEPSERDSLPVIADDNGVVWVCKIGVAQRCAVTAASKRITEIKIKEEF